MFSFDFVFGDCWLIVVGCLFVLNVFVVSVADSLF